MMSERNWGSIEILNELRSLNHPQIGYHISQEQQGDDWVIGEDVLEFPTGPSIGEELEDVDVMYIRLEEFRHWTDRDHWGYDLCGREIGEDVRDWIQKKRDTDLGLVNDFLENSLHDDNGLSYGEEDGHLILTKRS